MVTAVLQDPSLLYLRSSTTMVFHVLPPGSVNRPSSRWCVRSRVVRNSKSAVAVTRAGSGRAGVRRMSCLVRITIEMLPDELLAWIFEFLDQRSMVSVIPMVCQRWRGVCRTLLSVNLDFSWAIDGDTSPITDEGLGLATTAHIGWKCAVESVGADSRFRLQELAEEF